MPNVALHLAPCYRRLPAAVRISGVATWRQFSEEEPELAAKVRARFEAAKHHVLATLRSDGSPRVSGTEVQFHGPDLVAGMMHESMKALDLRRDGRFALHANPSDPAMRGGDAKVAGRAEEVLGEDRRAYVGEVNPPQPFHLFRLSLEEAVLTSLHPKGDRLLIELWRPGQRIQRAERA